MIKLTFKNGTPIWIIPVGFTRAPEEHTTCVYVQSGFFHHVLETPEEILAMIEVRDTEWMGVKE
jgi:hypothetical protein